ncbi:hypothetical protein V9W64_10615 [Neisseria leonii]|uniref:Uncharacterized protein n=1 Tax=Neisseria leonii TaxID=2995413 RepID=A0A9X4IBB5_9NEIS|nr:hypothetical protein [Neisseria sp. 51.81]MDD9328224.1 hypothetical protein [Neisseria sp. 51.81]
METKKPEGARKETFRELLYYIPMGLGIVMVTCSLFAGEIPFGDAVTVFIVGFFMTFFFGIREGNRTQLLVKEARLKDEAEQLETERQLLEAEKQQLETERQLLEEEMQELEEERQELEAERQRLETYVEEARKQDEAIWHKWRDECEARWEKWVAKCEASLEESETRHQKDLAAWQESNAKWEEAVEACEAQIKLLQKSLQESENENRILREKYEELVNTGDDVIGRLDRTAHNLRDKLHEAQKRADMLQMKLNQIKPKRRPY